MRVLVCGAESWTDCGAVEVLLGAISHHVKPDFLTIIEGHTSEVDIRAAQFAIDSERHRCFTVEQFDASLRNRYLMGQRPEVAIVFDDDGWSPHTAGLVFCCWEANVPVLLVTHAEIEVPFAERFLGLTSCRDIALAYQLQHGSTPMVFPLDPLQSAASNVGLQVRCVIYRGLDLVESNLSDEEISERLDEWEKILGSDNENEGGDYDA